MSQKLLCEVYRSPREQEMYLYVNKSEGLAQVPPDLLKRFGVPELVTILLMTPERKLARATAEQVIESIGERGFYLQMPPAKLGGMDAQMAELAARNEKLPR